MSGKPSTCIFERWKAIYELHAIHNSPLLPFKAPGHLQHSISCQDRTSSRLETYTTRSPHREATGLQVRHQRLGGAARRHHAPERRML